MTGRTTLLAILFLGLTPPLRASTAPAAPPRDTHVVEVHTVDEGGGQWRFEPSDIEAQPGDTVRFIQDDIVPHNVQFKSVPKGAKLDAAMMGPFLLKKGDTYDLVIDSRFVAGTYHFVCTPHEAMGMKGTLEVVAGGTDGPRPDARPSTSPGGIR